MSERRFLRLASTATLTLGLVLGALVLLGPLRDVDGGGWSLPLIGAGIAGLIAVRPRRKMRPRREGRGRATL